MTETWHANIFELFTGKIADRGVWIGGAEEEGIRKFSGNRSSRRE